jgi:hypothetical protein
MGMQSASIQQSTNPSRGKGMGSSATSGSQGDFGNPNVDNAGPMLPQFIQGPSNNGQWDPTEGGGMSGIPNNQQYGQPSGKGGRNVTMPSQGGQPRMGMPNAYSNTIQPWDNASIQPQKKSGKGKG